MGCEKMADENLHAKHRARMQERVERDGLDSLAEHEALEYLLFLSIPRADTNALAHRLIQHFGDFCKVLEAEPEELMQVEGVGPKSARLISTVMACSRYYELKKRKTRLSLNSAETAIAYARLPCSKSGTGNASDRSYSHPRLPPMLPPTKKSLLPHESSPRCPPVQSPD